MATDQAHKPRQADLTPEQKERVEAIRAKNRTPEARAEQDGAATLLTVNTERQEPSRRPAMVRRWATWSPSVASSCPYAVNVSDWTFPC